MKTILALPVVLGTSLLAAAVVYYVVNRTLRYLNIAHRPTIWSLIVAAVILVAVPLAFFALVTGQAPSEAGPPSYDARLPRPPDGVAGAAPPPERPSSGVSASAPPRPAPSGDVVASVPPRPRPSIDVAASAPPRPAPSGDVAASVPPRPRPSSDVAASPASEVVVVTASRLFAGPSQYPPEEFAAYGILAFRSRASSQDLDRHLIICEAYITGLPHVSELRVERSRQMVTVWPTDSDANATRLNRMPRRNICDVAVDSYGLATSLQAIKEAVATKNADISGIGPFLLAWSPSTEKGKSDALVLVMNLSGVTTYGQAQEILAKWSHDIEQNPELWRNGWDVEKLRFQIRLWVDKYGPQILALFGA